MPISVKVDTRELDAAFKKIRKQLPKVTARAINETAKWAKTNAEKDTAREIEVPLKIVKKPGKRKRTEISPARKGKMHASLYVWMRGIPVYLIAGKPTKRQHLRPGVKTPASKGGRFYKGAFYAGNQPPYGFVFKRRRSGKLMMPKVGVRTVLNRYYELYLTSPGGVSEFRRRWRRLAQFELTKIQGK